jgi:histidinol-phosphatase
MQVVADLDLAHRLADAADEVALRHFGRHREPVLKRDGTIVTAADLEADREILGILTEERPDDAVLSEESGERGEGGRRWLIDPIDGTSVFHAGGRDWGTHVSLEVEGEVVVAVLTRPTEDRRWWAARGIGAFGTDGRLVTSQRRTLEGARVGAIADPGSADLAALSRHGQVVEDEVGALVAFLEGRIDVLVDDGGSAWDIAPAAVLVPEAGGVFRDPLGGTRIDLGWALYCNGHLAFQLRDLVPAGGA